MSYDPRFDEAEADVDFGDSWRPKDEGAPNPLTIIAEEWSEGNTDYGLTDFLRGRDREGKLWSILVGSTILRKGLIEGLVEEWSESENAFVLKETLGKVAPGEVVSIKYLGEEQGAKFTYSKFKISRKPPVPQDGDNPAEEPEQKAEAAATPTDDDIPFS